MNTINYLTPEEIAHRLEKPRKQGKGWKACCPAHDDHNPSLYIDPNDEPNAGPLVKCRSGCDQASVIEALRSRGLWPERNTNGSGNNPSNNNLTRYPYKDEHGTLLFTQCRLDIPGKPKKMWIEYPTGKGKGDMPNPRPLYRLSELLERKDAPVLIVEGEKTVGAAEYHFRDHVVVTSANGCDSPHLADWKPLRGRNVAIWPDADTAGDGYAETVARLANKAGAERVRIVQVPETLEAFKKGWDLADTMPGDIDVNDLLANAEQWPKPGMDANLIPADKGNELELSDNLINAYTGKFAYRIGGRWYRRDGGLWALDNEGMAIRKQLRKDCRAAEFRSTSTVRNMVNVLAPDLICDKWDENKEVCGLPSGKVLDLRTGIVRDAEADEHITRRLGCDPADSGESELWNKTLTDCLPDLKSVEYLKVYAGYCLTGHTREQNFIFANGTGSNGKTTILGTIEKLLGDYHTALPASVVTVKKHDEHPEALAKLDGARLATLAELPSGARWNEERIKQLTGGDVVTGRFMRQNSFDFYPQCKLITTGNSKPRLSTVNTAIERRLLLLPFLRTLEEHEQNEHLQDWLKADLPGVLVWAINGAMDYLENGLPDIPESMKQASQDYMAEQDIFGDWFNERISISEHGHASNDDLLNSFNRFTKSEHHVTITKLGDYILQHVPTAQRKPKRYKHRKSAVRGIEGIELPESDRET